VGQWNPSNRDCIIINVDGSCLGSPIRDGFGGLLRSSVGNWIRGYSRYIPYFSDILYAELTALFHGLSLARSMSCTDVICYSDSLLCVKILHEPTPKFHKYAALIQDLIHQDWLFHLSHTLREGNNCADFFLAKLGASSNDELLINPPSDIKDC
jgi:ribonuclease HI